LPKTLGQTAVRFPRTSAILLAVKIGGCQTQSSQTAVRFPRTSAILFGVNRRACCYRARQTPPTHFRQTVWRQSACLLLSSAPDASHALPPDCFTCWRQLAWLPNSTWSDASHALPP
jgi:hypothetical protein